MTKHAGVEARAQALALKAAGMSWKEIGERTGMTPKALKLLFRRAKLLPVTVPLTVPTRATTRASEFGWVGGGLVRFRAK